MKTRIMPVSPNQNLTMTPQPTGDVTRDSHDLDRGDRPKPRDP